MTGTVPRAPLRLGLDRHQIRSQREAFTPLMLRHHARLAALLLGSITACGGGPGHPNTSTTRELPPPSATDLALPALPGTPLSHSDDAKQIDAAIESHFQTAGSRRGYLMTDKPLYQPGETLYYRADIRSSGTLIGSTVSATMQLISPRGAIAAQHRVLAQDGVATSAFELPGDIAGGEYTLQLPADDGTHDTRKVVINTYEAPRMQKTIEFVKKA